MNQGSLVVVGTGIQTVGHITPEALGWLKWADKVVYLVADKIAENAILKLKPDAESLERFYEVGKPRFVTYRQMVDHLVACVQQGMRTCAAYYGHPGIFAYPAHAAIRKLRAEGYEARMLPGISAEDCLFADLGVDPATHGCQSYEATHFVIYRRRADPAASLVLWQIDAFGQHAYSRQRYETSKVPLLVDYLAQFYPLDHQVCVYEAPMFIGCAPRMDWVPLGRLGEIKLTAASTLYAPPAEKATLDVEMAKQLGLPSVDEMREILAGYNAPPADAPKLERCPKRLPGTRARGRRGRARRPARSRPR